MMAVDGAIAGIVLQMAGKVQGAVSSVIAQAAEPGPDVVKALQ